VWVRYPRPAQQRADPCLKLEEAEGFREVIVCPEIEATRLVYVRVAVGKQHDRYVARTADPVEDLPPQKVRQLGVQYH
jgi:hypothetical protein